jgi:hypothetical protein
MAAFTLTAIALALAAGGAATKVVSTVKAGNAAQRAGADQQAAAESEAQLSDYNAKVADLQATDAIARGANEESRFRQGVQVMIGSQRAGIAASNIDVSSGSAADVQGDAAYLGELDALTIRTNAAREAWGYQVQGQDLTARAAIQRKEGVYAAAAGQQASSAANWSAAGTIVGTGASLLESRYGFGSTTSSGRSAYGSATQGGGG